MNGLIQNLTAFTRANLFPLGVFVVLRVWTGLWASVTASTVLASAEATKHYYGVEPLRDAIIAPWQRWDTIWYSKIAVEGYAADARVVFAPLYPFLMRMFSLVTLNNVVAAGLLVSSIAALASFILLYRLARDLFDEPAARRALLFLAVFPTAFFLFAAYTESLFLAFVLGAFLCARRGRWDCAGGLGALAAMTRPQGVLFVVPLAIEFFVQARQNQVSLKRAWTLLLVALGGAAHFIWLTIQFGSPAVWFQGQMVWHRAVLPWDALSSAWAAVFRAPSLLDAFFSIVDPLCAIILLGALIWSGRKLPSSFTVYFAMIVLPPLFVVTTYSSESPLTAISRYALVAFPFFLLLGSLPKRWWQAPLFGISFLFQTFWLMLFVAWVFVH